MPIRHNQHLLDEQIKIAQHNMAQNQHNEVVANIRTRMLGHDFIGEILDDEWCDHIEPRLAEYIYPEEYDSLDDDAKSEAIQAIRQAFVVWLYEGTVIPPAS